MAGAHGYYRLEHWAEMETVRVLRDDDAQPATFGGAFAARLLEDVPPHEGRERQQFLRGVHLAVALVSLVGASYADVGMLRAREDADRRSRRGNGATRPVVQPLRDPYAYATLEVGNLKILVRNFNWDADETNRTVDSIAGHLGRVSADFHGWTGNGKRLGDGDPDRPVVAHAGEG